MWLQSQWEGHETNTERIFSILHRLQININKWEASVKTSPHFSSVEINRKFNLLNTDVENLSRRALMAVVSTGILRDILGLQDLLIKTKWPRLRNASSQFDVSSLRPEIQVDLPSLPRTNLSGTATSVNRMYSDIEVQSQTLHGSEPNFDSPFEGGNIKLSLLPVDNVLEVQGQTCMVRI